MLKETLTVKRLLLAVAACMLIGNGLVAVAQDLKIGFVSTERVFREAAPAVEALKRLEKEFAPREAEIKDVTEKARIGERAERNEEQEGQDSFHGRRRQTTATGRGVEHPRLPENPARFNPPGGLCREGDASRPRRPAWPGTAKVSNEQHGGRRF